MPFLFCGGILNLGCVIPVFLGLFLLLVFFGQPRG